MLLQENELFAMHGEGLQLHAINSTRQASLAHCCMTPYRVVAVTTCSTLAVPIDNPKAERKPCSLLQILAVTHTGQPTAS